MHKLTLSLCLLLLAASCTIEKRVYQPGCHLEWNHHRSAQHPDAVSDASLHSPLTVLAPPANELRPAPGDILPTNDSIITSEPATLAVFADLPPVSIPEQPATGDRANRHSVPGPTKQTAHQPLQRRIVVIPPREAANEHLPTDPLVILMWVLDGIIVAAIILTFVLLILASGGEMLFLLLLGPGLFGFLVINAVLGIIAMHRRKSPEYAYRDSELVFPVFGAVLVIFSLFLLLLLALIVLVLAGAGF